MTTANDIATQLKAARIGKGLSQRALGALAGAPQSHISKIEGGAVDLQLSSLIELARALDLEVRLVPRKAVLAVDGLVRAATPAGASKERARLDHGLRRTADVARKLDRLDLLPNPGQLAATARLLRQIPIPQGEFDRVRTALDQLTPLRSLLNRSESDEDIARSLADPALREALTVATATLQTVRNRLIHGAPSSAADPAVRPAYALDEEEDDA